MTREEIHTVLRDDIVRANDASRTASDAFAEILNDVPSGIPHTDGKQRLRNASIACAVARTRESLAMKRYHDFVFNGIVPEDLEDWSQAHLSVTEPGP